LDYNKLKSLIKDRGLTLLKVSSGIGLTETGFYQAIKNNTLKVRDLEKISKILELPVSSFFEEPPTMIIQNGNINLNGKNTGSITVSEAKHEIEVLNKEIVNLKEIISGMKRELDLKDQIIDLMKESKIKK